MKKCPVCKAEIPDDARFCIHCITSFQEKETITLPQGKRRWWLWVLLAFLLIGIVIGAVLLFGKQTPPDSTPPKQTVPSQTEKGDIPDVSTENSEPAPQVDSTATEEAVPPYVPDTTPGTAQPPALPENTAPAVSEPKPSEPKTTDPEVTEPEVTEPEVTEPEVTEPEATEPVLPQNEPVYLYRAARTGDDFSAHYTNTGNDIVITGIKTPAADGVYAIPSHIEGKRVIAITSNAFTGSGARVIYLPTTVKTVWRYAFNGCPVTDIYFTHNVYIETIAFYGNTESLTIHCPGGCQDRNLRTYRDCAAYYDAVWEEWNG